MPNQYSGPSRKGTETCLPRKYHFDGWDWLRGQVFLLVDLPNAHVFKQKRDLLYEASSFHIPEGVSLDHLTVGCRYESI